MRIWLELAGNLNAVGNEHVITLENGLPVELDSGKGIQPIKGQNIDCALFRFPRLRKLDLVRPRLVRDPFGLELVES